MDDEWINSRERAVEVVEGQIGLAEATNTPRIAIDVKSAKRLIESCLRDHCTPEERAVVEAACVLIDCGGVVDSVWDEAGANAYNKLETATSALLTTRKEQNENTKTD